MAKDELLMMALDALKSVGVVEKNMEDAQQARDAVLEEFNHLHYKLHDTQATLKKLQNMRRKNTQRGLQGHYLDNLDCLVTQLCDNMKEAYCNEPSGASHSSPSQPEAPLSTM